MLRVHGIRSKDLVRCHRGQGDGRETAVFYWPSIGTNKLKSNIRIHPSAADGLETLDLPCSSTPRSAPSPNGVPADEEAALGLMALVHSRTSASGSLGLGGRTTSHSSSSSGCCCCCYS